MMSETISLLPATAEDAEAIRSLTREAYSKWVPVIGCEPLPMIADYTEAVQKHRIDLLYLDGKLVALIEMVPQADHLLIENVAVSPAFQRRGLGRKLLTHAEQVAALLGLSVIKLYTNRLFTENLRLYQKFGYEVDREEEFRGRFVVHMSKPVQANNVHCKDRHL